MTKRKQTSLLNTLVLLGLISGFAIWMEHITPLFADDFSYRVSFATKQPMRSMADVFASQRLHYFTTNGRTVVHTLAQMLLWLGKPEVDIVYGLLFGTFCLLICLYWTGDIKKTEPWQIAIVFAALWFLTPSFGGSYLWKMGAANYLLSPQIILLFFLPYRVSPGRFTKDGSHRVLKAITMLCFGVIAGWTNENTRLALIIMIGTTILLRKILRFRTPCWMVTGFLGSCIGTMLLFFSPAQAKRLSAAGGMGGSAEWIHRFKQITWNACHYLWVLILLGIILTVLIYRKWRNERQVQPEKLLPAVVFFVGTLVSAYSMVGSPAFPAWAWSSIAGFALITVGNLLHVVVGKCSLSPGRQAPIVALALAAVLISYHGISPELHRIHDMYASREIYIEEEKQAGNLDLEVPGIFTQCTYSSYSLFSELEQDDTHWPNTAIANYYDIHSISLAK